MLLHRSPQKKAATILCLHFNYPYYSIHLVNYMENHVV